MESENITYSNDTVGILRSVKMDGNWAVDIDEVQFCAEGRAELAVREGETFVEELVDCRQESPTTNPDDNRKVILILSISVAGVLLVVLIIVVVVVIRRKLRMKQEGMLRNDCRESMYVLESGAESKILV
jgi:sensor domain CHASE-containing protein